VAIRRPEQKARAATKEGEGIPLALRSADRTASPPERLLAVFLLFFAGVSSRDGADHGLPSSETADEIPLGPLALVLVLVFVLVVVIVEVVVIIEIVVQVVIIEVIIKVVVVQVVVVQVVVVIVQVIFFFVILVNQLDERQFVQIFALDLRHVCTSFPRPAWVFNR